MPDEVENMNRKLLDDPDAAIDEWVKRRKDVEDIEHSRNEVNRALAMSGGNVAPKIEAEERRTERLRYECDIAWATYLEAARRREARSLRWLTGWIACATVVVAVSTIVQLVHTWNR